MKQKLLKTLALGLLLLGGFNGAWADNTVRYSIDGGSNWTEAADLNALSTVFSNATTDIQVQLLGDQTLTSRVTWGKAYTLTITATKAVSISRGSLTRTSMWFLNNGTGTLTLGSSDYAITFAGAGHADNQRIFMNILGNESTGRMNIENVTFQNFKFDTENTNDGYLFLNRNTNGKLVLKNVTVSNCITTEDAFVKSISTSIDYIYLQGAINFNNCTGTHFKIAARIRLGEKDGSSNATITASTTPLTINWASSTTTIGTAVVVKAASSMLSSFSLVNENMGLFHSGSDIKLTQAYSLSVTAAGAATLVLPFASTIPSGATCYNLSYTSGNDISAETVSTTLAADKAVLVKANEGSYKFVSTATSGDLATGSGTTDANGVMVGVYTEQSISKTSGDNTNYILQNQAAKGVGFYKIGNSGHTVNANRAYMSVTHSSTGGNAPAFFSLDFGGTTGISVLKAVDDMESEGDVKVYSLQGVEMTGDNLPRGIYIKNGKKFIVK